VTIRTKVEQVLLLLMLCLWSLAWDFAFVVGNFQRVGRIKVFLLAAAWLAAIRFGKTWHWTVGLFYAYVSGLYVYSGMPTYGMAEFAAITATLFVVPELDKRITDRCFEATIVVASVVHCAFAGLNRFGIFPFFAMSEFRFIEQRIPVGLLGNDTLLAPFLVVAVAVLLGWLSLFKRRWQRLAVLMLLAMNLYVIAVTWSTMGFISLAAVVMAYALFYWGISVAIVAALLAVAAAVLAQYFNRDDNANLFDASGRFAVWKDAWALHLKSPWIGFGIGSWPTLAANLEAQRHEIAERACNCVLSKNRLWAQAHNEPLQMLVEIGGVGMSFVAAFCLKVAGCAWRVCRYRDPDKAIYFAAAAGLSANCLGNFTLHVVPHGPLLAYCLYKICEPRKKAPCWLVPQ
jgi:O-antigen ligase